MERLVNNSKYRASLARREGLRKLHVFCSELVPNGFATLELWLARYDKNPNIFYMVEVFHERESHQSGKLVGAFTVTPVNKDARDLLEQGKLKGVNFTIDHITAPGESPAAIYISGIVAFGFTAKGVTLGFLNEVLEREAEKGNCLFYTRPMSKAGLRLVELNGFSLVDPSASHQLDRIYRKEMC
jgi:hypothetical protein